MFWIQIVLFLLPAYFANSSAVVFGGKTPLDLGYCAWDGRPWLGKGKTFKGTAGGIFVGTLCAVILANAFPTETLSMAPNFVVFGFLISVGALLGDLVESFFKRRFNIESGKPVLVLDQIDFLVGALVLGSVFFIPTIEQAMIMALVTVVLHKVFNWIAFRAQLKSVPW